MVVVVVPPLRHSGVATAAVVAPTAAVAVVPPTTTVLVVVPPLRHSTWPQGPSGIPAEEAASWAACQVASSPPQAQLPSQAQQYSETQACVRQGNA